MAPYHMSLGEQGDMSQDTSTNEQFSDEDDDFIDEFPSLPLIPVPDILPSENSLSQLLAQACGGEDLLEVTSVKLKVIASQVNLLRLHIYLPNLVELDLTGSHLLSLRPLGYGLEHLCVLSVGRCSLTSLDGVFGVSGLRELYAPNNSISELGLLATLPQLRVLDMRSNPVASLQQVAFLSMCAALRELTLAECPVADLPGYKACVVTTLPALGLLDGNLLADGGFDICHTSQTDSPDLSDDDNDGCQTLKVEELKIIDDNVPELKDVTPVRPVRPRPATVSGARPSRGGYLLPDRPATAASKKLSDSQLVINEDPEIVTHDAVSKLTSGGIVCGNLAAALRSKHRQRKPAWTNKDAEQEKLHGKNGLTVTKLYSDVERIEAAKLGGGDVPSLSQPLLDASRRWREAYHSFRTEHREKWEQEEIEESEK
ncbi:leucine-rich repeat-containing protein 56 [Macrosteles quadrilineatus]|uniref:leucine-rich repeat-containing protein 56 n=1 Tax=Macrosteles quadrilineatus TaxID=74068 RepID=UPI0023E31665|nr:leucine-rich repeat-containing protein 56 [Macrosteles quadrilineatus]